MRYFQLRREGESSLAVATDSGLYDLTSATPALRSFEALARAAAIADRSLDAVARRRLEAATPLEESVVSAHRRLPLDVDEVWAAGVTYQISEEARRAESGMPDIYVDVYDADRPEVFFKATGSRTVGPDAAVGIRGDSEWNVPEPELGVVLFQGDPVGYTIGNDVSSRAIEGENPLYLPQAKVYDRCCAVGPCVATGIADPHDLSISMSITRDSTSVYQDETSTANLVRSCEELVSYFTRHNTVPDLAVVLTGTSLVPDEEFTLQPGDTVRIEIEGIGTLRNEVIRV